MWEYVVIHYMSLSILRLLWLLTFSFISLYSLYFSSLKRHLAYMISRAGARTRTRRYENERFVDEFASQNGPKCESIWSRACKRICHFRLIFIPAHTHMQIQTHTHKHTHKHTHTSTHKHTHTHTHTHTHADTHTHTYAHTQIWAAYAQVCWLSALNFLLFQIITFLLFFMYLLFLLNCELSSYNTTIYKT